MKYLIVGLGNIGEKYTYTRHNIGFLILDFLVQEQGVEFQKEKLAYIAMLAYRGRQLYLLKPTTYMNLSGNAVRYWQQKCKIPAENLLIITDDLHLPLGKIRLRTRGSSGGHNGIAHIETVLGNNHFPRLRCGIGNNFLPGQQALYVLSNFTLEEEQTLTQTIEKATQAIKDFTTQPIQAVMHQYNQK